MVDRECEEKGKQRVDIGSDVSAVGRCQKTIIGVHYGACPRICRSVLYAKPFQVDLTLDFGW